MILDPSLAAGGYARARDIARPEPTSLGGALQQSAKSFAEILATADQTAQDSLLGKADPHSLVRALSASELAVETAVTLRDKVVEAYQEILRMPV